MSKKILTLGILGILTLFATGCTKYAYEIEIDGKNNASFKETVGINKNVYKYTLLDYENVTENDYKTVEKEALSKGFEIVPFEDDNFKGFIKSKNKIKIKKLNNSVLPAGFTTEGRSPVYIVKNCIFERYIVSLKYNIYDAKDVHKHFIKKYRTGEHTKEVIKEKINSLNTKDDTQEKSEEEAQEKQIEAVEETTPDVKKDDENTDKQEEASEQNNVISDEELENIVKPNVQLRIKIPKKAKKHNATEVLNDYEYVWNLDSQDDVMINLEYQKPNIPSIVVLVLIAIGGIVLLVFYLKNKEE